MKSAVYIASICKEGILGGAVYLDDEKITYRTNKLSVTRELRNLKLYFHDIMSIEKGGLLIFPVVTVKMKNGEEWKFIIFNRRHFWTELEQRNKNCGGSIRLLN